MRYAVSNRETHKVEDVIEAGPSDGPVIARMFVDKDVYDADEESHPNVLGWYVIGGEFVPPQPFGSWTLNVSTKTWEPPVPYPSSGTHIWNEEDLYWKELLNG